MARDGREDNVGKRYKPKRKPTPIEKVMGNKVPVRRVKANTGTVGRPARKSEGYGPDITLWNTDAADRLSEMEKLTIQLDLAAEVPKHTIARKFGLSTAQVRRIGREQLNLTGQLRERFEATATKLVTHAHRMLAAAEDENKINRASLSQLSIASGIALDKAVAIDKHLHGTHESSGDLILEFGSRQALEKAILKKFKDNPLFKAMSAKHADATAGDVQDAEVVGDAQEQDQSKQGGEQLELFEGTEEVKGSVPALFDFAGKEEIKPGLLRRTEQPLVRSSRNSGRADEVKDQEIEKDLSEF